MSKTAEFALENMCRSMGQQERAQQQRMMEQACDTKTLQAIVEDNRASYPSLTAKVSVVGAGRVVGGDDGARGWAEVPSIDNWKPDGLAIMDAMVDQQDAIDKAARVRELAEAARAEKELRKLEKGRK
jgi:hypothetical protein